MLAQILGFTVEKGPGKVPCCLALSMNAIWKLRNEAIHTRKQVSPQKAILMTVTAREVYRNVFDSLSVSIFLLRIMLSCLPSLRRLVTMG